MLARKKKLQVRVEKREIQFSDHSSMEMQVRIISHGEITDKVRRNRIFGTKTENGSSPRKY